MEEYIKALDKETIQKMIIKLNERLQLIITEEELKKFQNNKLKTK